MKIPLTWITLFKIIIIYIITTINFYTFKYMQFLIIFLVSVILDCSLRIQQHIDNIITNKYRE